MKKEISAVEKLCKVADAAGNICQHYQQAIAERGRQYSETYKDPTTKKEQVNCVMVPVKLLNELLKACQAGV